MNIDNIISNCNCIKKHLKQLVDNYIFLVLNAFHHVQTTFNAILSKYYSNKTFKSASYTPSESQISSFNVFKRNKVHFTKTDLKFEAREKINLINSDGQKEAKSCIIERSIYLEMNKTEFLSESSE